MGECEIDHTATLLKRLLSLYTSQENFDVTFDVDGEKFHAHRVILASQSDFFKTLLFNNQFKEGQLSVIPIQAHKEAFGLLLRYFYTAKLSLDSYEKNSHIYSELMDLARKFGVESLEKPLEQHLLIAINVDSVIEISHLAVLYELKVLKEKCFREMYQIGSSIFQQAKIELALLKEILKSPVIKVTIWKFYALRKWAKENPGSFTRNKKVLTRLIDVNRLSNFQITKILGPSKLFDDSLLFGVLVKREADVPEERKLPSLPRIPSLTYQGIILKLYSIVVSLTFKSRLQLQDLTCFVSLADNTECYARSLSKIWTNNDEFHFFLSSETPFQHVLIPLEK